MVALCWGWIDSIMHRLDGDTVRQRWTPRKPASNWSRVNIGLVEQLITDGRMQPAGLAALLAATAAGGALMQRLRVPNPWVLGALAVCMVLTGSGISWSALPRPLASAAQLAIAVEHMLASSSDSAAGRAAAAPWSRAIVGSAVTAADWWCRAGTMSRPELVEHLTALCWDGGAALPFVAADITSIDGGGQ